jgi:hypothetical protein
MISFLLILAKMNPITRNSHPNLHNATTIKSQQRITAPELAELPLTSHLQKKA